VITTKVVGEIQKWCTYSLSHGRIMAKCCFSRNEIQKNRDILDFACQITLLEVSGVESAKMALFALSATKTCFQSANKPDFAL